MPAIYLYRFLRLLIVLGGVLGLSVIVFLLAKYTYPFIFALFIAFLINPVVNILEKKLKMPRGFAVFLVILIILALLGGLITILIVEIINGMTYLADVVPQIF